MEEPRTVFESAILEKKYRELHPDEDLGAFPDVAKIAVEKISESDQELSSTNHEAETTGKAEALKKLATDGGIAQANFGQKRTN